MSATLAYTLIAICVLSLVAITVAGLHYGRAVLSGEEHDHEDDDHDARGGAA